MRNVCQLSELQTHDCILILIHRYSKMCACCAHKQRLHLQITCFILVALSSWVSQLVHSLCRSHFSQEWQGVCTHRHTLMNVSFLWAGECEWQFWALWVTGLPKHSHAIVMYSAAGPGLRVGVKLTNDRWTDPDKDWQTVWLNLSVEVVE